MKSERRRLPIPPTDILTVLVCTAGVFFVLAFGGKALEGYRLQRHNALLHAEIAELDEENKELAGRLEYVQKPEYVEKVAREQYKWAKAGETLVITILRKRPAVPRPTPAARSATAGAGWSSTAPHWSEWWSLLVGPFD